MTYIRLEALDTLYFGTGKPFTMGDDSWAEDIFPPFPSTVYGMLRAWYFKKNMHHYYRAEENNDPTTNFKIHYYGLESESNGEINPIFPLPLDIVENQTDESWERLKLMKQDLISSDDSAYKLSLDTNQMLTKKIRNTKGEYFLTGEQLEAYLSGKTIEGKPLKLSDLLVNEPKIGISRNRRNTEEKALYRINQTRPETRTSRLRFVLGIDTGNNLKDDFFNRLGGEGKLAYTETLSEEYKGLKPDCPLVNRDNEVVKMYLATPGVFENGEPELPDGVKILAAATGTFQYMGGWNAKKKRPRPMYNVVPAGSAYYLSGNAIALREFITKYHGKTLKQAEDGFYQKQGFGLVYFANTNYKHIKE